MEFSILIGIWSIITTEFLNVSNYNRIAEIIFVDYTGL